MFHAGLCCLGSLVDRSFLRVGVLALTGVLCFVFPLFVSYSIGEKSWKTQFQKSKMQMLKSFSAFTSRRHFGKILVGLLFNSRVSDWIPARCFEAPLSPQNGFSSLLEPSLRLTWFLLKLLTYSAIKSHKKNLIWSQSGPRIGTKIGPRIGAKIGTRIGTQIGPRIGTKKEARIERPILASF